MSLTRLLNARRGPVWDWFVTNLPATQGVATFANRQLRSTPEHAMTPPDTGVPVGRGLQVITLPSRRAATMRVCPLPSPPGSDTALVGTAIGYVLTATLAPDALRRSVAVAGARKLDSRARGREMPSVAAQRAIERIAEMHASAAGADYGSDVASWRELCQLALVLARCEQWFRAQFAVWDFMGPLLEWDGGELAKLAGALADPPTLADLDSLSRVATGDWDHLSAEEPLHIGPTFAQSSPLGGADADVIAAGVLLDFKAAQTRVVGRMELWQLAGYLLADTYDDYRIHRVGFGALRWRSSVTWETSEFLSSLSDGVGRSLADWRHEFAEVLVQLPARSAEIRRRVP